MLIWILEGPYKKVAVGRLRKGWVKPKNAISLDGFTATWSKAPE